MDWLTALWADITAHIQNFEFTAPRTVDQLTAWIAFLAFITGLIAGAIRLAGRILPAMELQRPISEIAILRKALEELEASGFLDERTQSFAIYTAIRNAEVEIGLVVVFFVVSYLLFGPIGLSVVSALFFFQVLKNGTEPLLLS